MENAQSGTMDANAGAKTTPGGQDLSKLDGVRMNTLHLHWKKISSSIKWDWQKKGVHIYKDLWRSFIYSVKWTETHFLPLSFPEFLL